MFFFSGLVQPFFSTRNHVGIEVLSVHSSSGFRVLFVLYFLDLQICLNFEGCSGFLDPSADVYACTPTVGLMQWCSLGM